MLLRDRIANLSADLNDAAGVTWSASQLLRWFNEGRCAAFTLVPGNFAQTKLIALDPGNDQVLCDCDVLHDVLGITDATGVDVRPLVRYNYDIAAHWLRRGCDSPATPYSFSFKQDVGSRFTVFPPIMPGQNLYAKVVCYNQPTDLTAADDTAECAVVLAAQQWALFRALMVDSETAAAVNAAQVHAKMFFEFLKLKYNANRMMQLADMGAPSAARTPATSLGL